MIRNESLAFFLTKLDVDLSRVDIRDTHLSVLMNETTKIAINFDYSHQRLVANNTSKMKTKQTFYSLI